MVIDRARQVYAHGDALEVAVLLSCLPETFSTWIRETAAEAIAQGGFQCVDESLAAEHLGLTNPGVARQRMAAVQHLLQVARTIAERGTLCDENAA